MKKSNLVLCHGLLVLTLLGCASAQKEELVSTDKLEAAVSEVTVLLKEANIVQADLLSYDEYVKGSDYLAKAQRGLSDNHKTHYIQENATLGKAQFQQALKNSEARTPNAFRILEARKSSLDTGLKDNADLAKALKGPLSLIRQRPLSSKPQTHFP